MVEQLKTAGVPPFTLTVADFVELEIYFGVIAVDGGMAMLNETATIGPGAGGTTLD
ncbi:MAG TPA: hypothetical protein VGR69_04465 [Candidatus Rubrimentiphilum sp.]|nr:hypothetical protein [Candidatus Rubrimentiphilum sp.]